MYFKFWWPPSVIKGLSCPQLDIPWVYEVVGHRVLDFNFCAPGRMQTGAMEVSGASVFRFSCTMMLRLSPSNSSRTLLLANIFECLDLSLIHCLGLSFQACLLSHISRDKKKKTHKKKAKQQQKTQMRTTSSLGNIYSSLSLSPPQELDEFQPYPVEIVPGRIYLGNFVQACNPKIQKDLKIKAHVNVSMETGPL